MSQFKKVRFTRSEQLQNDDIISEISDSENPLIITPKYILKFENGNDCCTAQVTLFNSISKPIAYKFKTTSPEKFRLNMGCGILNPGLNKNIVITLSQGYYLQHDKFQILSMILEENNIEDVNHLWKNSKDKTVFEHRIMCEQMDNIYKSETLSVASNQVTESEEIFQKNVLTNLSNLTTKCDELQRCLSQQVTRLEYFIILMIAMLISCLIFGQRPVL